MGWLERLESAIVETLWCFRHTELSIVHYLNKLRLKFVLYFGSRWWSYSALHLLKLSLCSCEHVVFSDPYEDLHDRALFLGCLCGVKPQQGGIPKIRGLGQGSSWVQARILGICPTPWALSFKKHEANFSKNLNICRSWGIDHDTYFLRVEGILHLWSLCLSKRDIQGHKRCPANTSGFLDFDFLMVFITTNNFIAQTMHCSLLFSFIPLAFLRENWNFDILIVSISLHPRHNKHALVFLHSR